MFKVIYKKGMVTLFFFLFFVKHLTFLFQVHVAFNIIAVFLMGGCIALMMLYLKDQNFLKLVSLIVHFKYRVDGGGTNDANPFFSCILFF